MTKKLIITGASAGIGKSIAMLFHMHDWGIINLSRSSCDIPEVKNFRVDLTNNSWPISYQEQLVSEISDGDRICIIHNAGTLQFDSVSTLVPDQLQNMMQLNLYSPILLNQILLPKLTNDCSIIYMGSYLSENAIPNAASYIIVKHALVGLMRATCSDLAGSGIITCCICPGLVDTKMIAQISAAEMDSMLNQLAIPRLIKTEEIAELALFCANNPIVNGKVLHANMGFVG